MNSRSEMLNKVQKLGFVVVDVSLYLDTHPNDAAALQFYDKYKALLKQAQEEYTASFGPLNRYSVDTANGWAWIDQPWPWELEA